jgi:hypothetical protein
MGSSNSGDRPMTLGRTTADQDDRIPRRGEPSERATPEADRTKRSDRGGSAGWGNEGSGGSVIDKRSPEKKK